MYITLRRKRRFFSGKKKIYISPATSHYWPAVRFSGIFFWVINLSVSSNIDLTSMLAVTHVSLWWPTFLRRGSSPGDVAAASASFSFAEWALAREFSLQCSVPLAAQGDVECLVGSTSLLDVEGVMLKIQTWSEKKEDIYTTRTGTYLCRLKTRLQVQNPTIEK